MTKREQIIALAELDGWKRICGSNHPVGFEGYNPSTGVLEHLPNYLTDLNAVHELEKKLLPELTSRWENFLALAVYREDEDSFWTNGIKHIQAYCAHATAAQRCEAILRTTGKWKGTK